MFRCNCQTRKVLKTFLVLASLRKNIMTPQTKLFSIMTLLVTFGIVWIWQGTQTVHAQDPVMQSIHPISNIHTAPLTTVVSITYDQSMNISTVSTQTFAVHAMQTGLLSEAFSVNAGTISLIPNSPFMPGELVQVSATTGTLSMAAVAPLTSTVWQFHAAVNGGHANFIDSTANQGANKVWLNDGSGGFTDSSQSAFVANNPSQANKVWLNDGSGIFTDSGQSLGSSNSLGVHLGDVDGDGDLDAFVANHHNQANNVWLNDGSGGFTDSGQSLGSSDSCDVHLGDVDGDGDLDAFVANYSSQANKVWLNDGSGTFSDSGQSLGSSDSFGVHLGDMDGDGDTDAFVANLGQANNVWLNDGSGGFTDSGQFLGSLSSYDVHLGDVDGDGDLDAFVANYSSQANKVWLNDGSGTFSDS
ncbi:MAG: hypothetical protein B6242_11250 [Anaerolineaceae bacterium 4572_78]|nr:MAG: hypothetical protein B6242_11250 [Anaerolineaceae bacterium 4572_78]